MDDATESSHDKLEQAKNHAAIAILSRDLYEANRSREIISAQNQELRFLVEQLRCVLGQHLERMERRYIQADLEGRPIPEEKRPRLYRLTKAAISEQPLPATSGAERTNEQ